MMGFGKCIPREISGGVYTFLCLDRWRSPLPKGGKKVRSHDKLGGMGVAPSILSRWCIHPTEFDNTTISIKNLPFLKAVEVRYLPCKITPSWVSGINDFAILLLINQPNSNSTGVSQSSESNPILRYLKKFSHLQTKSIEIISKKSISLKPSAILGDQFVKCVFPKIVVPPNHPF